MSSCTAPNCDRIILAMKLCSQHYQRFKRNGTTELRATWDGEHCSVCNGPGPFSKYRKTQCKICFPFHSLNREVLEKRLAHGRQYAKDRHARLRSEVLSKYGGKCQCCGEWRDRFLVIDHVHGNGSQHRRDLSASKKSVGSSTMYEWLSKNNWPDGFQVLCHNCNHAKSCWPGGCPHGHN